MYDILETFRAGSVQVALTLLQAPPGSDVVWGATDVMNHL